MSSTQALDRDMAMRPAMNAIGEAGRRLLRAHVGALAVLAGLCGAALAQSYPTRPIRLIVPFAAGGANDIVARLIQPDLEKALGQPIIIENKPAATGIVGTDLVAKATPDGYSLLMAFTTHTVNPAVNAKLPYDAERDLAPVILIGKSPLLFIVNPKVPAKTIAEFVALAKANPASSITPPRGRRARLTCWWRCGAGSPASRCSTSPIAAAPPRCSAPSPAKCSSR